jgi:uncharacterized membrane protein
MSNTYLWLKTIHILGVVLFLGNIIVTGWWKFMADRTQNPQIIAFAQRQVTLTDYVFTAGGALILLVAAYANMGIHQLDFSPKWLSYGHTLFIVSGVIWLLVLIPLQIKQARMARAFSDGSAIPDNYWKLGKAWYIWGALATLLPLANLYFMVFKPV